MNLLTHISQPSPTLPSFILSLMRSQHSCLQKFQEEAGKHTLTPVESLLGEMWSLLFTQTLGDMRSIKFSFGLHLKVLYLAVETIP